MPLTLPDKLPAIDRLKEENIFVIDNTRASSQDIRPLKIAILNLMPLKIEPAPIEAEAETEIGSDTINPSEYFCLINIRR